MKEFAEEPIEFFTVYVREPHAGEARFWRYRQPQTYQQKRDNARMLVTQLDVTMPILVDEMDELAHRRLGRLPNMVYVVDITGRIVYKSMWTRSEELRDFLKELVSVDWGDTSQAGAAAV